MTREGGWREFCTRCCSVPAKHRQTVCWCTTCGTWFGRDALQESSTPTGPGVWNPRPQSHLETVRSMRSTTDRFLCSPAIWNTLAHSPAGSPSHMVCVDNIALALWNCASKRRLVWQVLQLSQRELTSPVLPRAIAATHQSSSTPFDSETLASALGSRLAFEEPPGHRPSCD